MDTPVKVEFDLLDLFSNLTPQISPPRGLRVKHNRKGVVPIQVKRWMITNWGPGPRGL